MLNIFLLGGKLDCIGLFMMMLILKICVVGNIVKFKNE
jgi:hypothetical protein